MTDRTLAGEAARLTQLAIDLKCPENAFDDAVHDGAQEVTLAELNDADDEDEQEKIIARSEARASNLNNGGFEAQFAFLLEGYSSLKEGVIALEAQIRERAAGGRYRSV